MWCWRGRGQKGFAEDVLFELACEEQVCQAPKPRPVLRENRVSQKIDGEAVSLSSLTLKQPALVGLEKGLLCARCSSGCREACPAVLSQFVAGKDGVTCPRYQSSGGGMGAESRQWTKAQALQTALQGQPLGRLEVNMKVYEDNQIQYLKICVILEVLGDKKQCHTPMWLFTASL